MKRYLHSLGFTEAPAVAINTIVKGRSPCSSAPNVSSANAKADVVVRLHDTRLMAIECKVSNSATNSVKRLNNDAAVKAEYWLKQFGTAQVVPAAALAGVFNVLNLEQAQTRGLTLFWSHDLDQLGGIYRDDRVDQPHTRYHSCALGSAGFLHLEHSCTQPGPPIADRQRVAARRQRASTTAAPAI